MTTTYKLIATFSFALLPILLWANVTGADPRLTSAPGDSSGACTQCHAGTKLNGGGGSVAILLPGDATYTPGVKLHDVLSVFLNGHGGIDHVVDDIGAPVSAANQVTNLVSFP